MKNISKGQHDHCAREVTSTRVGSQQQGAVDFDRTNSSGIQLIMPEYRHAWEWGSEIIVWMYQWETDVVVGSNAIPPYPLTINVFSVAKY
jgi:hypothetical protein